MNDSISPTRRIATLATVAVASLGLALGATTTASAQTTEGETGWLRVAHLSPDTKNVDVQVTAVAGGAVVYQLDDVGYGAVSPYSDMAEGTYIVQMTPSDAPAGSTAAITAEVDVEGGAAATVAAYGPSAELETTVFTDDLTAPATGDARIRLVQASTLTDTVDVKTDTGQAIATDARTGTATDYATIGAGSWNLELSGESDVSGEQTVEVAGGSVTSLFVLDDANGDLQIISVVDSAAAEQTPIGGVDTGGGYFAIKQGLIDDDSLTRVFSKASALK